VDLTKLRDCLGPAIFGLHTYPHSMLSGICAKLKIPFPAQAEYKKDRMQ
jgi:hypothetical protein